MKWVVLYHKLVYNEDLKGINPAQQKRIVRVADKKLSLAPDKYGFPLAGKYHGLWKLPIGDFRVIYAIKREKVIILVVKIGKRRDDIVYKELFHRLKRLGY